MSYSIWFNTAKHTIHTQRCQCLVCCQCFCNGSCTITHLVGCCEMLLQVTYQRIQDNSSKVNVLFVFNDSAMTRASSAPTLFPEITYYMQLYWHQKYLTSPNTSTFCWLSTCPRWNVHHQNQSDRLQLHIISHYITNHTAHTHRCQCLVLCQCFCNGTCSFNTNLSICNYMSCQTTYENILYRRRDVNVVFEDNTSAIAIVLACFIGLSAVTCDITTHYKRHTVQCQLG